MKSRTLKVDALARVEGEGGLLVKVAGGKVTDVKLQIYEPPRFFEAFLRGRSYAEAPDITARICGICPVAYQMSSVQAMEDAFGTRVFGSLRSLRRLLYCGEWIESHALHIYLLHAPDFLGYEDAIRMAKDHGAVVQQALRLKKLGNEIVRLVGGREIHPINVRVGGFYKLPTKAELTAIVEELKWGIETSLQTVKFTSKLPFPDFERDYEFVALRHDQEYAITDGRIVSSKGLNISIQEYEQYFVEEHVEHSNALHSLLKERGPYFVGPLARFNLNQDTLSPLCQEAARGAGIGKGTRNPFQSIIVRAVELLYACEEALRIIREYDPPSQAVADVQPRPAVGYGCTEAPRGILYHRYRLDEKGMIIEAKIIPPTSQNLRTIEQDVREYVSSRLKVSTPKLTWQCEQAVRNYDPCISCATHFVTLQIEEN